MAAALVVPKAGDIGVTPSSGWVAFCIRLITRSPVAHAFLYVGGGNIIEGDPHGARQMPVSEWARITWLTGLSRDLSALQRDGIVAWADRKIGTPYSWIDDAAIGLRRLFGWAPRWMLRRLGSDRTLMCSQLCVAAYRSVGVDLFPEQPDGAVAPGDLLAANLRVST